MTISLEMYRRIRKLHLVEKRSQREIARLLGVSRKTIRKYCKGDTIPGRKKNTKRNSKVRQAVEPLILGLIEENSSQPKKQQLDAKTIWRIVG